VSPVQFRVLPPVFSSSPENWLTFGLFLRSIGFLSVVDALSPRVPRFIDSAKDFTLGQDFPLAPGLQKQTTTLPPRARVRLLRRVRTWARRRVFVEGYHMKQKTPLMDKQLADLICDPHPLPDAELIEFARQFSRWSRQLRSLVKGHIQAGKHPTRWRLN
jgi:hypothetical protein